MVTTKKLEVIDGVDQDLKVDILLMHGESPSALDVLREVKSALTNAGVRVEPYNNFIL